MDNGQWIISKVEQQASIVHCPLSIVHSIHSACMIANHSSPCSRSFTMRRSDSFANSLTPRRPRISGW